ncbi:MAG: prepilin peptidase [Candidatus Staskawiczbacteria bacterium]|nr:prepilin peptidase [Candidatus Staskawiczbacteria bacterium]
MSFILFVFNFFVFLFGISIGSFLNCVVYRIEKNQSFLKGRSYCPKCKHNLSWLDLIPIFSFLFFRGNCRHCHKKISWQYPIVEILTAAIFLLIFNFAISNFINNVLILKFLNLGFLFYIVSSLIIISVYDLKHYIIPDKVLYPCIAIVFLYQLIFSFRFLNFNSLWAGLSVAAFFLFIFLVSGGRWMGFGDVKLAFFMGLFLGYPNILVAMFLAFFLGAIIGVGLIIFGSKNIKSEVPFGPFLITGTFLALLWGQEIIDWYLRLFLF